MIYADLMAKSKRLSALISEYDSLLVAFSGGVDSTLLLAVAQTQLKSKVLAVTAGSPIHSKRDHQDALAMAKYLGARHRIIHGREFEIPEFTANPPDRCYICKNALFADLGQIAVEMGIQHVAHGANVDDRNDYRPGARAAMERGIVAPLADAGLTKAEIRKLSREMGLPTWKKPAMTCLATRIPYGKTITQDKLHVIETAEERIMAMGFTTCRVRHHGAMARIEVLPEELYRMLDRSDRALIVQELKAAGFDHITLDLEGYVQGSLNQGLRRNLAPK